MFFHSTLLSVLLLFVPFQSPADSFRRHYEKAEASRRAGDTAGAEAEYRAILAEAYPRLGRVYAALADRAGAVAAFEAADRSRPDSADVLVELSIAYFNNGQYKKAVEPLRRALALDPQSVPARHMLGKTYFMLGEFGPAAKELETALQLAPRDYDVAYTLGLAYLKPRQFAPAKAIYDRMVEQLGDRPQLRVLIGRAYRETGFLAEAIEEFKKAAALDPKFPRVHYYLGLTYLLKDGAARLDDAAAEFKVELAANPGEYLGNYYLGIVYTIERKWDLAAGFLETASRLKPGDPDPFFYLGQVFQGMENHERAVAALKQAIALSPSFEHNDYQVTNAHFRLGQSLVKLGRTQEGEKELQAAAELKAKAFKRDEAKTGAFLSDAVLAGPEKLSEVTTTTAPVIAGAGATEVKGAEALKREADFYEKVIAAAHNNVGLLRAERQDFRAAAEQFAAAARWNPRHDGLDFNLGLAYFKLESYKEAVPPLEDELKARPSNLQAKQLLGLSYFMTENYARASELLSEVVNARPQEAALYYPLALSLGKQGKAEEAAGVIRQMVSMGGDSPELHILLGQAYYDRGETAKAIEELRAALALNGKTRLAHFYLGVAQLKLGNFEEAAREFEAELALNPADLQAKYNLGYVLLARQESERGVQLLREVIREKPDFGNAHFELGKALLQLGDVKSAVESLEAAAKLSPEEAHVHYQLGRAYLAAGRKADSDQQLELSRQLKEKARAAGNQ